DTVLRMVAGPATCEVSGVYAPGGGAAPRRPPARRTGFDTEVDTVNSTTTGTLAGIALGFAGAFGGFGAFVVVLLPTTVGFRFTDEPAPRTATFPHHPTGAGT
ncbi:hypothetical protein ACFV4N_42430, partial [Actinosynnema sp. NPDC059797]